MKCLYKVLVLIALGFTSTANARFNTAALKHPHEPGELLVKIRRDSLEQQSLLQIQLNLLGVVKIKSFSGEGLSLYKFLEGNDLGQLALKIQSYDEVEYVELNHHHYLQAVPNDASYGRQYGLRNTGNFGGAPGADISAQRAWSITKGSKRIVVGVIDTGIDYRHPDLNPNIWLNTGEVGKDSRGRDKRTNGIDDDRNGYIDDYKGWDFYSNDNNPMDKHGHGTHVAGIIGARGNNTIGVAGVNWAVSLAALKVFSNSGNRTRTDALISAINYATRMGISITNNSWGSSIYSRAIRDTIRAAGSRGHLFVAAAGNNGSNNDENPYYPAAYGLPNIISVGATDSSDRLSSFSNYGVRSVDVAAPGDQIYSTLPGTRYGYMSGTSMAAPFVAGVAALVKTRNPSRNASTLKSKILNGSNSIKNLRGRVKNSRKLNAYRAVK